MQLGDSSEISRTPVFLKATAGMRVLPLAAQVDIMGHVRDILTASQFRFEWSWARIIAGEEEGIYGWLTAAKLFGGLTEGATFGALDMGGASTQVSFVPDSSMLANAFAVTLQTEVDVTAYTHSHLYYGVNEASTQLNNAAVALSGVGPYEGQVVSHPCYFSGMPLWRFNVTSGSGGYVLFNGTSDAAGCMGLAKSILRLDAPCYTDPGGVFTEHATCSVGGVYQPSIPTLSPALPPAHAEARTDDQSHSPNKPAANMPGQPSGGGNPRASRQFVAYGAFAYAYTFLGVAGNASLSTFRTAVARLCQMTYEQVEEEHPCKGDPTCQGYRDGYCMQGTYFSGLLQWAYRLPQDMEGAVVVLGAMPGYSDPGWALGSILFDANTMPWSYVHPHGGHTPYKGAMIALAVVCGLLALGLVTLFVRSNHRRGDEARGAGYVEV
jgi:hypothetical protein